ncbi:MAG: type IV secretion protein DotI [Proteobacteria bacterium]|nr:type IV secretion protein DotI [Pseudomonadota bacterium]
MPNAQDALATVVNRNSFYRDGYRLLLRISLILWAIIGLLLAALVTLAVTVQTRSVYFATNNEGRIIPIVPLSEPFRSRADIIAWTASTVKKVMQFNYSDYRLRLQDARAFFTPTGTDSFFKALNDARILEATEARKLLVRMDINAAPEVVQEGVRDGVYTWYLRMPITITYDGVEPLAPQNATLIVQVIRVSTLVSPGGIGIEQFVVKQ